LFSSVILGSFECWTGSTIKEQAACKTRDSSDIISVTGFNLGDRLHRNNLSFIKEFAPEIGRGVRLTYTLRFF